jgi:hypothetical protein
MPFKYLEKRYRPLNKRSYYIDRKATNDYMNSIGSNDNPNLLLFVIIMIIVVPIIMAIFS